MSKTTGLGMNMAVGGYDVSGDVGMFDSIATPRATLDVTPINKLAFERIAGKRDGLIEFTAFFNPGVGAIHEVLSPLPRTDTLTSVFTNLTVDTIPAVGNPACSMVAKQLNYDPTREEDGAFTFGVTANANAYGLEWGESLTEGTSTVHDDEEDGATLDGAASTSFGWQAYLHVIGLDGDDVTVTLEDSANSTDWTALTGGAFAEFTDIGWQRLEGGRTATVRRYTHYTVTGTFTTAQIAVVFVRNLKLTAF